MIFALLSYVGASDAYNSTTLSQNTFLGIGFARWANSLWVLCEYFQRYWSLPRWPNDATSEKCSGINNLNNFFIDSLWVPFRPRAPVGPGATARNLTFAHIPMNSISHNVNLWRPLTVDPMNPAPKLKRTLIWLNYPSNAFIVGFLADCLGTPLWVHRTCRGSRPS